MQTNHVQIKNGWNSQHVVVEITTHFSHKMHDGVFFAKIRTDYIVLFATLTILEESGRCLLRNFVRGL